MPTEADLLTRWFLHHRDSPKCIAWALVPSEEGSHPKVVIDARVDTMAPGVARALLMSSLVMKSSPHSRVVTPSCLVSEEMNGGVSHPKGCSTPVRRSRVSLPVAKANGRGTWVSRPPESGRDVRGTNSFPRHRHRTDNDSRRSRAMLDAPKGRDLPPCPKTWWAWSKVLFERYHRRSGGSRKSSVALYPRRGTMRLDVVDKSMA